MVSREQFRSLTMGETDYEQQSGRRRVKRTAWHMGRHLEEDEGRSYQPRSSQEVCENGSHTIRGVGQGCEAGDREVRGQDGAEALGRLQEASRR